MNKPLMLLWLAPRLCRRGPDGAHPRLRRMDGEERGLLGAEHYAKNPIYPHEKMVANLTMNILQTAKLARDVVLIGEGQSELEDYLAFAARAQGRSVPPESNPERDLFYRADHFAFAKQRVPVLLIMALAEGNDLIGGAARQATGGSKIIRQTATTSPATPGAPTGICAAPRRSSRCFHFAGSQLWALLTFVIVGGVLLILADRLIHVSQRERELNRKLQLVRGELQHRIKNFISIAQALSAQTGRTSADIEEFDSKFGKRLHALAGAQSLIDDPSHSSAGLALLIERTLAPFQIDERVELVSAPDLRVSEDVALGLALVLNELATNALKYGALSCPGGKVRLSCDSVGGRVSLLWREVDGPRVEVPKHNGFGTRLITSALPRSEGTVEIDYPSEGVICRIEFACTSSQVRKRPD